VQGRGVRPAIPRGDADLEILGRSLRVFEEVVEVPVVVEDPRIVDGIATRPDGIVPPLDSSK
jgi:hypothetical protein